MNRKVNILLLILLIIFNLVGCSNKTDKPETPGNSGTANKQPVGLYMFEYYCDENGNYVAEYNEEPDYSGYPRTEIERFYDDKKTFWVKIDEEGKGEYHSIFGEDEELELKPEENDIWFGDIFHSYTYDPETDSFWYGADNFFTRMKKCDQQDIDYVYEGKGGSVPINEAEVGDMICIGNYDTVPFNEETENLYWRVIDKKDGKILVLCDKLIDSFSFNYNPEAKDLDKLSWEYCSLREFLNNEFLEMMFTDEERALIETTTVENKTANEELLKQWGNWEDQDGIPYSTQTVQTKTDDPDTQDKVFLLSYQEVLKYFGEPTEEYEGTGDYPFTIMKANPKWKALVTISVDENAIGYFEFDTRYGAWMTRTLSTSGDTDELFVVYITSEGQPNNYFTYTPMFIRPAMWIRQS